MIGFRLPHAKQQCPSRASDDVTIPVRRDAERVLRNAASAGQFLSSPLVFALMSRALGAQGYGRWWWTFAVIELTGLLGSLGAELYVRRELPGQLTGMEPGAAARTVGGALGVVGLVGGLLALAQIALAVPLAATQGDPELAFFLAVLAVQPLLVNLSGILGAALQSADHFEGVAVLRGLVMPGFTVVFFAVAWWGGVSSVPVLLGMVALSTLALAVMGWLFSNRFDLGETLSAAIHFHDAKRIGDFGLPLLTPALVFTLAGKIDFFVLGHYAAQTDVGLYGACLQLVSVLPNLRTVFDPIAQRSIGMAHARDGETLARSLDRLGRLCAITFTPPFVLIVAVGEPLLEVLLGRNATGTAMPLVVLASGQLFGGIALASWLVSMRERGAVLTAIALVTLATKAGLLFTLTPRFGMMGAALATAAGTVIALHGQAWIGASRTNTPISLGSSIPVLIVAMVVGAAGAGLLASLSGRLASASATTLTTALVGTLLLPGLLMVLTPEERRWCWNQVCRLVGRSWPPAQGGH